MINFRNWLEEPDPRLIEGMLALYKAWCEADEPVMMNPEQGLELKHPGKHLKNILPKDQKSGNPRLYRPDVQPSTPQNLANVLNVPQGGQNVLIKIDDLKNIPGVVDKKLPVLLSHFVRDQPFISAYSQASADNFASTIIFVLMTIRSDFMQVMQDFPIVMMKLMAEHQKDIDPDAFRDSIISLQKKLASISDSSDVEKNSHGEPYRTGYGTGGTLFGSKWKSVAEVWKDREKHYSSCMNLVSNNDTVAVFGYLLNNINGLAQAKAGFCVQLIFGELGCIDMHNVNLYSQYYLNRGQKRSDIDVQPDHLRGQKVKRPADKTDWEMYKNLNPTFFSKKPLSVPDEPIGGSAKQLSNFKRRQQSFDSKVQRYINVLTELEQDGFNTIKLWDIWVGYVSNFYKTVSGSRYSRVGAFAGNPLDPHGKHIPGGDPADKKIMKTGNPIPDRNAIVSGGGKIKWKKDKNTGAWVAHKGTKSGNFNPLKSSTTQGMEDEQSAGAASLAHGATWWWRQPDYWWDMLRQAESSLEGTKRMPKDVYRYSSGGGKWTDEEDEGKQTYDQPASVVAKPLAYLAIDDKLMNTIFPEKKERQDFSNQLGIVLRKLGFFGGRHPHVYA